MEEDMIIETVTVEKQRPQPVLSSGRTLEEIETTFTTAKLDKLELQPVSQEILFDTKFASTEFRLVQLDKDILQNIQQGDVLVFRGDENDAAVLCTKKETYEVKDAETSNSLLLFSDLQMPIVKSPTGSATSSTSKSPSSSLNSSLNTSDVNDSAIQDDVCCDSPEITVKSRMIIDVAHSYLELKKIRPNLSKIRFLLRGTEFEGITSPEENEQNSVTLNTLLEKVPASEEEILKYLDDIRVLDMNGKLRLVDDEYLFRIFSQILNCVDENSWNPNEIDKDIVIPTLSSFAAPFFLEKVFQWFFRPFAEPGTSSSKSKFTFQEDKVCRFLGETLLKSMGKFNMKEFMKVWHDSVPEGLKVNLNQLCGAAVYDEECSPPVIWHFPEYNLPDSLTERLALLFDTKKRWKLDEISPFIELFTPPLQNVGNILTKYARSTTVNGTKLYTSKHGK